MWTAVCCARRPHLDSECMIEGDSDTRAVETTIARSTGSPEGQFPGPGLRPGVKTWAAPHVVMPFASCSEAPEARAATCFHVPSRATGSTLTRLLWWFLVWWFCSVVLRAATFAPPEDLSELQSLRPCPRAAAELTPLGGAQKELS